ncbi:MAG: tetratricopeptide repeat protein, partial [Deltaproteobacteria bacterium]|nr:tetratricopeptide repeat protein [Deltaproteobacteria bacterium]
MLFSKNPQKKAKKLEAQGDQLFSKGDFKKALKKYQASQELDPERPEIYHKLNESLNQFSDSWNESDFEKSMDWTLRQQALENPISQLAIERLSLEYQEQLQHCQSLLVLEGEALEKKQLNLYQGGKVAALALSDFLISLKKAMETPQGQED